MSSRRHISLFAIAFLVPACGESQSSEGLEFKPKKIVRSFPAIVEPDVLSADLIKPEQLRDDELVLGVVLGDEARAYAINMLTGPQREIINDKLGGRAIAATW